MERGKYRLQKENSQKSVNKLLYQNILLSSDSRPLPYNDIVRVINENEQFDIERQNSNRYRFSVTLNGIFSNSLFNVTGDKSWSTFNESSFRDRTYPPNGISANDSEDFTYLESIAYHLKERNGWFGYLNPRINAFDDHEFNYMEPGKDKFDLLVNGKDNWELSITYPSSKLYNKVVENGLKITSIKSATVGNKSMVALCSPYTHNLTLGNRIRLFGTGNSGDFEVMRVGMDDGELKENVIVIDANLKDLNLSSLRFKKIHKGIECDYYLRVFKRVKTIHGEEFSKGDFDIYNLAFSKNIYDDQVVQFTNKNDVDLTDLTDNLGRPVSELYLTVIKTPNYGFTKIKSGLYLNNVDGINKYLDIPDIRRIHNGDVEPFTTSKPLNDAVNISDDEFIGDLVEYNPNLLLETVLSEVHHRFNTTNREENGSIKSVTTSNSGGRPRGARTSGTSRESGRSNYNTEQGEPLTRPDSNYKNAEFNDETNEESSESNYRYSRTNTYQWEPSLTRVQLLFSRDSEEACTARNEEYYYIDTSTFSSANSLSDDSDGTYRATAGYYSDLKIVRHWDGNRFTSSDSCGGSSGCSNMRATYSDTGKGTLLGGYCYETQDDTEGGRYYLDGQNYYEKYFAGGSNTSCNSIDTSRSGVIVDQFQYGLTTIKTGENEEIRRVNTNYDIGGVKYTVYVKWTGTDTIGPSIDAPYFVCNEAPTQEENPTQEEPEETTDAYVLGFRQEGYFYKPFHKIQIRNFSDYIEYGDESTVGIPEYATKTNEGYMWRDIMNIGFKAGESDYPFTNGAHYIHKNIVFPVKRQDPFGVYGLRYDGDIPDIQGIKLNQDNKVKRSGDDC
jgi:hypothetical protein